MQGSATGVPHQRHRPTAGSEGRPADGSPIDPVSAAGDLHLRLRALVPHHDLDVVVVTGTSAVIAHGRELAVVEEAGAELVASAWVRRAVADPWPARTRCDGHAAATTVIDGAGALAVLRVVAPQEQTVIPTRVLAQLHRFGLRRRALLSLVRDVPNHPLVIGRSTVAADAAPTSAARATDSVDEVVVAAQRLAAAARGTGPAALDQLRTELRATERAVADLLAGRSRSERRAPARALHSAEWTETGSAQGPR